MTDLSIFITVAGLCLSVATFYFGRQSVTKADGKAAGALETDLRYIKESVGRIEGQLNRDVQRLEGRIDEISNQLPGELKQAKTIVDSRSELITNAKREAENIMKSAQAQARQLVSQEAIYLEAKNQANDMVRAAQDKIKELKQVTNDYVDDSLRRTEEAIQMALEEVKQSRVRFRAASAEQMQKRREELAQSAEKQTQNG